MSAVAIQPGLQPSPFHDLQVSLDAHTLDITAGKRRLQAIQPDGTLTYEVSKTPSAGLTEHLERIWNEYPNGLLDLTEEKLSSRPSEATAVAEKSTVEEEEQPGTKSKALSWEEMEHLRSEIFLQLNEARNELWYVLELTKTLGQSSTFTAQIPSTSAPVPTPKKAKGKGANKTAEPEIKPISSANSLPGDPPVLPPGTYSVTPSLPPPRPSHQKVHELELALAAKQQALDECSAMIDSAVEELQAMAEAGDTFWTLVRSLKGGTKGRNQWAVVPKPDFGRSMAVGEKAKDVIIPYAVDEASPALRARCLAAFDLNPVKKGSLTFGARSYLRLRVTTSDGLSSASSTLPAPQTVGSSVQGMMEAVQLEAFDEDLFNEIRLEALSEGSYFLEPTAVKVDIGEGEVMFQLYDTRDPPPTATTSLICDLLVQSARLSLLHLHRFRKRSHISPIADYKERAPNILKPISHIMRYRNKVQAICSTLKMLSDTLEKLGLSTAVVSRLAGGDEADLELVRGILTGDQPEDRLCGLLSLEVQGCRGVTIRITPSITVVTTPRASFPITDLEKIPHVLANEVGLQLLYVLEKTLCQEVQDDSLRSQIFVDELEDDIIMPLGGIIRLSIPAPFNAVHANFTRNTMTSFRDSFDSRQGDSLLDWARSISQPTTLLHPLS